MEQKPIHPVLRGLYFGCSFIAAGPLAMWLSDATTGGSNFEGASGYATVLRMPFWFSALVLLFWLAYKPLRKNPPVMGLATAFFALATVPFFTFVVSLWPSTSYTEGPGLTEPAWYSYLLPSGWSSENRGAFDTVVEQEGQGRLETHLVSVHGYNYSNTKIDSFDVNGFDGGRLDVSTPSAGGGERLCCAQVTSGVSLAFQFIVRWTRDRKRWCEQIVSHTKPVPKDPRYLEVHFYPDGRIELDVTQEASPPRLKLKRASFARRQEADNVVNDEKFSRCKDGH